MNRSEHLQWCKDESIKLIVEGNSLGAVALMIANLAGHPETKNHAGISLGLMLAMTGALTTAAEAEKFILGFN